MQYIDQKRRDEIKRELAAIKKHKEYLENREKYLEKQLLSINDKTLYIIKSPQGE